MSSPQHIFDRESLVRKREKAAASADIPDFLLQRVADDLEDRLSVVTRSFPLALDLTSASGLLTRMVQGRPGTERVIATEHSIALVRHADLAAIVCDEEALPFAAQSFDLAVSGLSLQFVNDLPGALTQIRQALKPDGLFLGAILGGGTLSELRQATLQAEAEVSGGASPRVAPFADVRDLGSLLQRAGFALPVADSDVVKVTYPTPLHLMRELKAMAAGNILVDRRKVPMTRSLLMRIAEIYAEQFSERDGRVVATFEILTLTGWAPHESQQKPLQPGSARTRLADALGVEEHSAEDHAATSWQGSEPQRKG